METKTTNQQSFSSILNSPLLQNPNINFGKKYFAQTELITQYDEIGPRADIQRILEQENRNLKEQIQELQETINSLPSWVLGLGAGALILGGMRSPQAAQPEPAPDMEKTVDAGTPVPDGMRSPQAAQPEPAPDMEKTVDAGTPVPDAYREDLSTDGVVYDKNKFDAVPQQTGEVYVPLISDLISLGESEGNYDITFGGDKYQSPESFSGGKKLTEMTLTEVMQFQKQRYSTVENTGAMGKYQFIPSTLEGLVLQSGMNPDTTKFTPQVQEQLQSLLLKGNAEDLERRQIPVTPANLSLAHYVGPKGLSAVQKAIENGDGDLSVRDAILKYTGKDVGAQNEELIRTKAKEFEKMQSTKLETKAREKGIELSPGYFQQPIKPETLEPIKNENTIPPEQPLSMPSKTSEKGSYLNQDSAVYNDIQAEEQAPLVMIDQQPQMMQQPNTPTLTKSASSKGPKSKPSPDALSSLYINHFAVV